MSATLTLDKHELLWLAEGAMGRSHLRCLTPNLFDEHIDCKRFLEDYFNIHLD